MLPKLLFVFCMLFQMTSRIYKGIPNRLRGEVWSRLLEINKLKQEQAGVYQVSIRYIAPFPTVIYEQRSKNLKEGPWCN